MTAAIKPVRVVVSTVDRNNDDPGCIHLVTLATGAPFALTVAAFSDPDAAEAHADYLADNNGWSRANAKAAS